MIVVLFGLFGSLVLVGLMLTRSDFYDKKNLFFSVHVPTDFGESDIGRKVLREFRRQLWMGITIAAVLLGAGLAIPPHSNMQLLPAYAVGYLVLMTFFFRAHQKARKEVLPYREEPSSKRSATLEINDTNPFMRHLILVPTYFILIAAMGIILMHWELIPDRIPVRWNFDGEIVAWREKTVFNSLRSGLTGLALLSFLQVIFSPQYRGKGGLKQVPLGFSLSIMYFVAVLHAGKTFFPVLHLHWPESTVVPAAIMISVFVLTGILLTISTFVWRSHDRQSSEARVNASGNPDCWKNDSYNNPNDAAIFIEKPFGFGYTLNMGHPKAKWAIVYAVAHFSVVIVLSLI